MIDYLYHRLANRPYKLYVNNKADKSKTNIVFLHGIASDSSTWRNVLPLLPDNINPVTIDLLGFGNSKKPNWPNYNTAFHTKQVAYTLKKIGINEPVTIVGHSMGGLIAIELAKSNPSFAKNLILCGSPLYAAGEINQAVLEYKKTGRHVTNALFNVYERLLLDEQLTLKSAKKIMKLTSRYNSFTLTKDTWLPFKKSLQNCIMQQTALNSITQLKLPIHFIFGITDLLIISRHQKNLAKKYFNITYETVPGGHIINPRTAKKVSNLIKVYNYTSNLSQNPI